LGFGGNLPEVDITHHGRRKAKLCPFGPISMCNCNAIVVALLTPCSQMNYEIVVAVDVGQVRKVFNPPQKKEQSKRCSRKTKLSVHSHRLPSWNFVNLCIMDIH